MRDPQDEAVCHDAYNVRDLVIPVNKLVHILLVEDEPGNAESLREVLENGGYSVQIATTLKEAKECIDAMEYGMLISDNVLEGEASGGDSFLLESQVGNIPKVLVTGRGLEGISRKAELEQRGIPILTKGSDNFHDLLEGVAQKALEIAKEKTMRTFEPGQRTVLPLPGSRALSEARDLLLDWLSKRQNPNAQVIFYGGKTYSAYSLMREIEMGTAVGESHIQMFLRVMRQAMGF